MNLFIKSPIRGLIVLVITALSVSACSGSSGSSSNAEGNINGAGDANGQIEAVGTETPATTEITSGDNEAPVADVPVVDVDNSVLSSTRVTFDITVPVYVSDSLQVRLSWGELDTVATWVVDESWAISEDLPKNTQHYLVVTFSDANGAITLGSVEIDFKTGTNPSEIVQITADQFDTGRWDNDEDGVSNIEELIAESDPALANTTTDTNSDSTPTPLPVSVSIELIPDKTFRIRWQPTSAADFYRVLENPDGISGFTAVSGELDASTEFYDHRVGLHQRVNARYMVEACNSAGCSLSAQQLVEGNLVDAIGYLKASTLDRNDFFGSVVSISGDGNTLAVGAPFEDSAATGINGDQGDNSVENSGAVYIFTRSDSGWQQQAYLKASNTDLRDEFGSELSLSADGNTLAIGVADEDSDARGVNGDQSDNSRRSAGAVYVFSRTGASWQQQAYLKASNTGHDLFGWNISLSANGNTLAVGAQSEDSDALGINGDQNNDNNAGSGAVYVFVRTSDIWEQQAYIKASTSAGNFFGRSVSLSADGNIMAVGGAFTTGDVHMFERIGENWQEEAVFGDLRGHPIVVLSGDGKTVAVAANNSTTIFENIGGIWQEQASINKFGQTSFVNSKRDGISLSSDGNTLAVGRSTEGNDQRGLQGYQGTQPQVENSGAVWVYTRGDGTWLNEVYVKASNTSTGARFGHSVSLSANGDTLAVGAYVESGASIGFNGDQTEPEGGGEFGGSGAVYLY